MSIDGLEKIFFASNEAYFHLNGAVNNHNCRVWSDSEPDFVLEQPLYPEKVFVWCSVLSIKVIGPYFFDASVKYDNYLKTLTDFFGHVIIKVKMSMGFYFSTRWSPGTLA